jgi:hypothetical protein
LLSDLSFIDMTTNLVLNLQALGMEHYLVVATEAEVCVRFAREGIVTGCAVSSVLSSLPPSVWTTWDLPNQGKANLHLLWWQVRCPYAFAPWPLGSFVSDNISAYASRRPSLSWSSRRARALAVSQRWHLTAKVGELGYNVLVLDTDIAIHTDPYPHLKVIHAFLTLTDYSAPGSLQRGLLGWRPCREHTPSQAAPNPLAHQLPPGGSTET